jgi:hypothetical protein
MKDDFIDANRHLYGVKLLCRALHVSRSGFLRGEASSAKRTSVAADDAHHSDQRDPQCQP